MSNNNTADSWFAPKPRITNPTPQDYQQWGNELIRSFLTAGGLTAGGAALYHLAGGFNESQLPELLRDEAPAAVKAPPPKKKKPQNKKVAVKAAADNPIAEFLGKSIPQGIFPDVALPGTAPAPAHPVTSSTHESWRQLYNIAAAGLGGYAGLSLIGALAQGKQQESLADQVEAARQEYFDALQGKTAEAAALDAAYEQKIKTAQDPQPPRDLLTDISGALQALGGGAYRAGQEGITGLHMAALMSGIGTGGLGAMYMYNRTKDRTRAKNLERAQAAKMRLKDIQQRPWVDPVELAQLTRG